MCVWGGRLTRLSTLEPRVCPACAFRRAVLTHRCVLAQNECGWQELVRVRRVWAEAGCRRALGTACADRRPWSGGRVGVNSAKGLGWGHTAVPRSMACWRTAAGGQQGARDSGVGGAATLGSLVLGRRAGAIMERAQGRVPTDRCGQGAWGHSVLGVPPGLATQSGVTGDTERSGLSPQAP